MNPPKKKRNKKNKRWHSNNIVSRRLCPGIQQKIDVQLSLNLNLGNSEYVACRLALTGASGGETGLVTAFNRRDLTHLPIQHPGITRRDS